MHAFHGGLEEMRFFGLSWRQYQQIVFDKLLIEAIKERYDIEVVFIVRSVPTLYKGGGNYSEVAIPVYPA